MNAEEIIKNLLDNIDEDCPHEYRTGHLLDAMDDARRFLGLEIPKRKDDDDEFDELLNEFDWGH